MKPKPQSRFRSFGFPVRPISKDFIPLRGGHTGSESSTQLCVMEALNWANGNNLANASVSCVNPGLRSTFITLNDHYGASNPVIGQTMRKALMARVHRLLGTRYIPDSVMSCLTQTIPNAAFPHASLTDVSTMLAKIDTVLDSIDEWCEAHDPTLHRLRQEVPPITSVGPTRSAFLKTLREVTRGQLLPHKAPARFRPKIDRIFDKES